MEQVYAPHVSGHGSMEEARKSLITNGMSPHFAGILAARYIKGLEENAKVISVMDLFNNAEGDRGTLKTLS